MAHPSVGVIGLGRMGTQIARRLHKAKFDVIAWNRSEEPRKEFETFGGRSASTIPELVGKLSSPKIIWLMLPAGDLVDQFLFDDPGLTNLLSKGGIIIDGGNSFFRNTVKRAEKITDKGIVFYDSGTSGGIHGERQGFSLMVGGPREHWDKVEPIFKALASGDEKRQGPVKNYGLVGGNGAGHFVKMIHNGIEYGMMEAIAEGFGVMKQSEFGKDLDFSQIAEIWGHGSVVSSWLINLTKNIFDSEDLEKVVGDIQSTGEGEWMIREAKKLGVDVRVIEQAFRVRQESAEPKNQEKFSNKIVALLRKQFGGHKVKYKDK